MAAYAEADILHAEEEYVVAVAVADVCCPCLAPLLLDSPGGIEEVFRPSLGSLLLASSSAVVEAVVWPLET